MSPPMLSASVDGWFPIAASADLPPRHVYHAELLGQELAVWRADDGYVNVWENRCLHRGVRLSIGLNLGQSLKCQYHGWVYSSRTSNCTYIPAHPENAPARVICNKTFAAAERHGLIWSRLEGEGDPPDIPELEWPVVVLRSIPVKAPAADVMAALREQGGTPAGNCAVRLDDGGRIVFVQPQNQAGAILRGLARPAPEGGETALLKRCNENFKALRDRLENRR
jgi:nitrite reductase/ring-hydroxylating ferredoxin subunit